jgi:hypothetical protein
MNNPDKFIQTVYDAWAYHAKAAGEAQRLLLELGVIQPDECRVVNRAMRRTKIWEISLNQHVNRD